MYYTYIHYKKDSMTPFYIGKGQGNRYLIKTKRSFYWKNVVKKHGLYAEILAKWNTEKEALEHEIFLIKCFKDLGFSLVNMTDGGEGTSGWIPSEEWKRKKSESQKFLFSIGFNPAKRDDVKEKLKIANVGKKLDKDHKEKISLSLIGNKSRAGKTNSAESNEKRRIAMQGNKHGVGKKQSPESNALRSAKLKGIPKTRDVVEKQIAARRATCERKKLFS